MNQKLKQTVAETAPALDDLLLDVATNIELTDNDRKVAEGRYRRLKVHLERSGSLLKPYLMNGSSRIYPQGSAATGTTIVSGTDDERYDLDAMVEFAMPREWTPEVALDVLMESLKGFPDVREIERCTRCVQLRFAFMHLDVALLDPVGERHPERAGLIFHAPETGPSARVPSNPYGFADWFRGEMAENQPFVHRVRERRRLVRTNRFMLLDEVEQDALPPIIPPHLDTQRVVALKLLKRFTKLRYADRRMKAPPTIYMALFAAQATELDAGLCVQLEDLVERLELDLRIHIEAATKPDHRNPRWLLDRINDRWPSSLADMQQFARDLAELRQALARARHASFPVIRTIFAELFGENVTKRSFDAYLLRADETPSRQTRYVASSGAVLGASALVAAGIARASREVRPHNFHAGTKHKS